MKHYLTRIIVFALMLTALAAVGGCALLEPENNSEKTAQQLADEGADAFLNEDYKDAIKAYTDLKDWYPFSKYAILAELKIADSHFKLEQYDEAIVAYEQFEKLHPRNDAVPYIIDQIGLCWYHRIDTVDRDHSPAKNAMAQFQRLLEQFPDSEQAKTAPERIARCIDNIVGHELYVADFYFKTKEYRASLKRYEYIVEFYPETAQAEIALGKIPACRKALKDKK